MNDKVEQVEGKVITTTEHPDGRRDVTVEVHALDVDLNDPSNAEAKRVIEEEIIPALAEAPVTVTVIHKPTNDHASIICARKNVRAYAQQMVNSRTEQKGGFAFEYCVVEHDGQTVTVSTL